MVSLAHLRKVSDNIFGAVEYYGIEVALKI
jgi:hypothetical protein